MLTRILPRDPVEVVLAGLHESHDLSAYEAVERLLYTAEVVGVDTEALLRMLDQGIAFQNVLDLIVSRRRAPAAAAAAAQDVTAQVPTINIAPLASKQPSEPVPSAPAKNAPTQLAVAHAM